ncbi:MAG: ArnT family glycosyltransferase [Chloroflexota bacterium]
MPRHEHVSRLFLCALFAAVVVRLFVLMRYYCINSDGVYYLRSAQDFLSGDVKSGLASVYPPGYPLLIAAVYPLIRDWELTGQFLSFVFGVLLLLPLYGLLRKVFGERVALIAALLAAISPYLVRYSVHVRTESLYLFLSTAAIYLFLRAIEERRLTRFFLGGLVAGYAFVVRPEAIGFVALIPLMLLARWVIWKDFSFTSVARSAAALCLGFFLFALPFIVYLSIDTGHFGALSRKAGITLAINLTESGVLDADDASVAEGGIRSLEFIEYVRQHPVQYFEKAVSDLLPAIGVYFEALYYSYVPFLLIGLFLLFRDRLGDKQESLLLGFVAFYVFGFALIYVKRRYALQAVPISLAWVACGMLWLWDWLQTRYAPPKAHAIVVSVALIFLGATLPKTLRSVSAEKAYIRDAGRYLKTLNRDGALKVAVLDRRITFYADAKTVSLVGVEPTELSAKLRKSAPEYLAVEAKGLQKFFPDLAVDPARYGLKLEKIFTGTRKDRLLVYKLS